MNKLPSGWSDAGLEQIITFSIGGLWGAPPDVLSGESITVAVMRGADYRGWASIRAANAAIRNVSAKAVDTRLLTQGDLVVEVSGGGPTQPVGRVVLIDDSALRSNELPLITSNFCRRVVLSHEIIAAYVYYQLLYKYTRGDTERFQTATTNIRNLNFGKYIAETILDLAPRREQERIVAAIEEQFSRLDAGVAALERARQNLKNLRAAVLQAAVTGRLLDQDPEEGTGTELLTRISKRRSGARPPATASAGLAVPETWAVASLEAVTDPNRVICYGILKPKVRKEGTIPYVEVKDLRASRLDVAALHRTSAALHSEFSRSVLSSGDVVLAIRGSYDRALVVPPEVAGANMSRDVARIAPLPGIEASFVAAYLMSPPALQYLHERARGVAVKGVNIADVRSMPVPVPPVAEQKRIASEIDRINSIIEELESTLGSGRVRGVALRCSILAAAFSGKLAPQDPTDEPASRLLQRIGTERASSDRHKAGRSRKPE